MAQRPLVEAEAVVTARQMSFGVEGDGGWDCRPYTAVGLRERREQGVQQYLEGGQMVLEGRLMVQGQSGCYTYRLGNKRTPSMDPAHLRYYGSRRASRMLA